jgi:hypothetical protein
MKPPRTDTFVDSGVTFGIGTTPSRTAHQDQTGARVARVSVGTGTVGTTGIAVGGGTGNGDAGTGTVAFRTHLIGVARIFHVTLIIVAAKAQISKVGIEQPGLQGSFSLFLSRRPQRVGLIGIQTNALVAGLDKGGPTGTETGTIASFIDSPTSCHVRMCILGIQAAGLVPAIGQVQAHRRHVGSAPHGGGGGGCCLSATANTSDGPMCDRY